MSLYGNGKGYIGKSMSVNAREAYLNEEAPISKWTKSVLVDLVMGVNENLSEVLLKKVALKDLRSVCLKETCWHHTGAFYKRTFFYEFSEEKVLNLTNSTLEDLIERRIAFLENTKAERKEIADFRKAKRDEKKAKEEKEAKWLKLFPYASQKTQGGFLRACESGKIDFEKLNNLRKEDFLKKIEAWEKNINACAKKLETLDSCNYDAEKKERVRVACKGTIESCGNNIKFLKQELDAF